ncbi:hypothetical protein DF268_46005 [Streptomyces sp. V2]|nr:hypothetical protein DF268_46005 [Streptomyces sp. V2]
MKNARLTGRGFINSTSGGGALVENSENLSLIHISEPTRRTPYSYAVFFLKKKNTQHTKISTTALHIRTSCNLKDTLV